MLRAKYSIFCYLQSKLLSSRYERVPHMQFDENLLKSPIDVNAINLFYRQYNYPNNWTSYLFAKVIEQISEKNIDVSLRALINMNESLTESITIQDLFARMLLEINILHQACPLIVQFSKLYLMQTSEQQKIVFGSLAKFYAQFPEQITGNGIFLMKRTCLFADHCDILPAFIMILKMKRSPETRWIYQQLMHLDGFEEVKRAMTKKNKKKIEALDQDLQLDDL
ncbi:Hypothetical_protein [Hexamita inflata]|uniref:Hypothetical_protein n=1 Tax=Hexamita inflata TaxID=28002 RepID=A0ABP1HY68_9EUKA